MPSHLDRTRQEFTSQAPTLSNSSAFHAEPAIEPFLRLLGDPLPTPVLDLACGPGIVSAALARARASVTGLDATPAMISAAQERCAAERLETVQFREGVAEALPFDDGVFRAAVTRLSPHHLIEPGRALVELARVLAPGAPLIVGDIVSSAVPEEAALHDALEQLRDPSHVHCLSEAELLGSIAAAGFAVEHVESWDNPRSFDEWAAIVEQARSIEPLRLVMRALADAGADAGIDLRNDAEQLGFVHHWRFVKATAGV